MHTADHCLNCSTPIQQSYCPVCGQKTNTHRITVKHFVLHDLMHGVWHLEKGILFTLKETLLRPGRSALDYINGKRVRFYNIFYLTLLMIGFIVVLNHLQDECYESANHAAEAAQNDSLFNAFVKKWAKPLIFSFVPLTAINSWIVFRRPRLNFAEHNIIGGFCLLSITTLVAVYNIICLLPPHGFSGKMIAGAFLITQLLILLQPARSYYQAMKSHYTTAGFIWRVSLVYLMLFGEFLGGIIWYAVVMSNGHFTGDFTI